MNIKMLAALAALSALSTPAFAAAPSNSSSPIVIAQDESGTGNQPACGGEGQPACSDQGGESGGDSGGGD